MSVEPTLTAAFRKGGGPPPAADRRRLGRYELLTPIGRGGMGDVWLASDTTQEGRVVAIKTARTELAQPGLRRIFLEEARIASRVNHPNVVKVLELGENEDGTVYQVMELIEGVSLATLSTACAEKRAPMPMAVTLRVLVDALDGLHAIHELEDEHRRPLQVVHRDVSPHNILVDVEGVTRITDFGIAKALGRTAERTVTGEIKGKPAYLSPEQIDSAPLDRRCDLFCFGIVAWETLTGQRLFRGANEAETIANVVMKNVPDVRTLAPSTPSFVAEAVASALERDVNRRPATAEALKRRFATDESIIASREEAGALVRALAATTLKEREAAKRLPPSTSLPSPPQQRARGRSFAWSMLAAVIVTAIGSLGYWVGRSRASDQTVPVAQAAVSVAEATPREGAPTLEASAVALPAPRPSSTPPPVVRSTSPPQKPTATSSPRRPKYGDNPYAVPTR